VNVTPFFARAAARRKVRKVLSIHVRPLAATALKVHSAGRQMQRRLKRCTERVRTCGPVLGKALERPLESDDTSPVDDAQKGQVRLAAVAIHMGHIVVDVVLDAVVGCSQIHWLTSSGQGIEQSA
jgi:hypothetical protein